MKQRCGNCEYIKTTKALLADGILPIGSCRVQPPQFIVIKSMWMYPEVNVDCQPCCNYKRKGENNEL